MKKIRYLLFSYKGCINRKTYWLYHICAFIGYYILAYIYQKIFMPNIDNMHPELLYLIDIFLSLLGLLGMLLLYGTIPVTVKRLHDLNRSGWPSPWSLIPLLGVFYAINTVFGCCFVKGTEGRNRYGDLPK